MSGVILVAVVTGYRQNYSRANLSALLEYASAAPASRPGAIKLLSRSTLLSVKPAFEYESWDFDIQCAALPGL
jgi:hypothetical protein